MSTTPDLDLATLEELHATQDVLQRAHDWIETWGFNIHEYRDSMGAACHIGAARIGAGVAATPWGCADVRDEGEGVGYELTFALQTLDRLAVPDLPPTDGTALCARYDRATLHSLESIKGSWHERDVGRYVEALGLNHAKARMSPHEQQEKALEIYRAALTDIYERIQAKSPELVLA